LPHRKRVQVSAAEPEREVIALDTIVNTRQTDAVPTQDPISLRHHQLIEVRVRRHDPTAVVNRDGQVVHHGPCEPDHTIPDCRYR